MSASLLAAVGSTLGAAGIRYALIGARALAIHGVSRATLDIDVLVVDERVLRSDTWTALPRGASVDIRSGDEDDPLRGVVRIEEGDETIDVIVGRFPWQSRLLDESQTIVTSEGSFAVVSAMALVLLKLYAGGMQDLWDIAQLRGVHGNAFDGEVDQRIGDLPAAAQESWRHLKRGI